jgi:tripartite-type tricarboxylate transporter receptor subunit TctC
MYDKLPYDVDKDFAPISLLAIVPAIFVVHESVPAKNLREFVALAKKDPGKLNYGSAGNGSAGHLAMEYLKQVTGMELQHVPYKGTGPNVIDLVAGRTQASSAGTPPLLPHVKSGKLRVIAVGTSRRLHTLPDVGTVAEQGYPGFETSQWYGLNAPAKTPEAVIRRLAQEAAKAAKSPALAERFAAEDAEAVGSTPAEYAAYVKKEQERWSKVVRARRSRPIDAVARGPARGPRNTLPRCSTAFAWPRMPRGCATTWPRSALPLRLHVKTAKCPEVGLARPRRARRRPSRSPR